MVIFPDDLYHYGLSRDTFPIATAVRMSTTLPFFFQPYLWKTPISNKPYYMLDGGLLSNYPIWLFDVEGIPRWPTFGFRLSARRTFVHEYEVHGPISLFKGVFKTMLQAHDQRHVDEHSEERTIFIPTESVTSTKFDLTEQDKKVLYKSGRAAAQEFLKKWDFNDYKLKFRERTETPYKYYERISEQNIEDTTLYH